VVEVKEEDEVEKIRTN